MSIWICSSQVYLIYVNIAQLRLYHVHLDLVITSLSHICQHSAAETISCPSGFVLSCGHLGRVNMYCFTRMCNIYVYITNQAACKYNLHKVGALKDLSHIYCHSVSLTNGVGLSISFNTCHMLCKSCVRIDTPNLMILCVNESLNIPYQSDYF